MLDFITKVFGNSSYLIVILGIAFAIPTLIIKGLKRIALFVIFLLIIIGMFYVGWCS